MTEATSTISLKTPTRIHIWLRVAAEFGLSLTIVALIVALASMALQG